MSGEPFPGGLFVNHGILLRDWADDSAAFASSSVFMPGTKGP
jgi:hypothetical protein